MTEHISSSDLTILDAEPRVQDLRLAEALGFAQQRDIRKLIVRNLPELQSHGEVCAMVAQTSPEGGRPSTEYWLSEPQALLVTMFSRTERAADVRGEIVSVFMAWRRDQLPTPPSPAGAPLALAPPLFDDFLVNADIDTKLRYVQVAGKTYGRAGAQSAWAQCGFPRPLGMSTLSGAALADAEARTCLEHFLTCDFPDGAAVRTTLIGALEDNLNDEAMCRSQGLRIITDENGAEPGFVIGNPLTVAMTYFRGTPWKSTYHLVLRRLPGVEAARMKLGRDSVRGTFVPASYLDPAALV